MCTRVRALLGVLAYDCKCIVTGMWCLLWLRSTAVDLNDADGGESNEPVPGDADDDAGDVDCNGHEDTGDGDGGEKGDSHGQEDDKDLEEEEVRGGRGLPRRRRRRRWPGRRRQAW